MVVEIVLFIIIILICMLLVRSYYEIGQLEVSTYEIPINKENHDFKKSTSFVFLSDLHNNQYNDKKDYLIKHIIALNPDFIIIGGDMMIVKSWQEKNFEPCFALLRQLVEHFPVYYANGNHENRMKYHENSFPGWYKEFVAELKKLNITHLIDESIKLENGIRISAIDLDESYYGKFKNHKATISPEEIREKVTIDDQTEEFHIVLCHKPLNTDGFAKNRIDLVLSGHYHGGMIRLPKIGAVFSPELSVFPKYSGGLYRENNTTLISSRGLGNHTINLRFLNKPEIVFCKLVKEKDNEPIV